MHRQLTLFHLTHVSVSANNIDHRLIDNRTTVYGGNNVVFPVKTANQRNHSLRSRFSVHPVGQALVHLFVTHGRDPYVSHVE